MRGGGGELRVELGVECVGARPLCVALLPQRLHHLGRGGVLLGLRGERALVGGVARALVGGVARALVGCARALGRARGALSLDGAARRELVVLALRRLET